MRNKSEKNISTIKDQLQVSLDIPVDEHAKFRKEFEEAFALMIFDEKYHQYIKEAALKKKVSVKKFIQESVNSRIARMGLFK